MYKKGGLIEDHVFDEQGNETYSFGAPTSSGDEDDAMPVDQKKKGKKKKAGGPKNTNVPTRIKKTLAKWKAKFLNEKVRVTIIGCTSEPDNGSKKDFKKFFDKTIYFPFPDYSTRRLMWK